MKNAVHDAFDSLHADEGMKRAALDAYRREAERRSRGAWAGRASAGGPDARAFRRPLLAALCALFLLTGALGVTAYALPVSYISIDVNPSVQLSLNRFDRVIGVSAANPEGKALLDGLALNGMRYTDAVEAVVNSEAAQPYLADGGEVTFTVASPNEEALISGIRACECGRQGVCQSVPTEAVGEAQALGLSLGKYRMYLLIHPLLEAFTPEECGSLSMRRLRELYSSLAEGGAGQAEENGHGNGHGNGGQGNGNGGGQENNSGGHDNGGHRNGRP